MKPFKNEDLQTWSPSNMTTFKHGETFSRLQTWSHQHDNPQKDAYKHEAIRHEALKTNVKPEALQTWCPPNISLSLFSSARPIELVQLQMKPNLTISSAEPNFKCCGMGQTSFQSNLCFHFISNLSLYFRNGIFVRGAVIAHGTKSSFGKRFSF